MKIVVVVTDMTPQRCILYELDLKKVTPMVETRLQQDVMFRLRETGLTCTHKYDLDTYKDIHTVYMRSK